MVNKRLRSIPLQDWNWLICVVISAVATNSSQAQSVQIQFMASKPSVKWEDLPTLSPGHALFCLSLKLSNGSKEDCYGFYPRGTNFASVYGPGVVKPEPTAEVPTRLSDVVVSVTKAITNEQRGKILQEISAWNARNYSFIGQNCVEFAIAVAAISGLKIPKHDGTDLPHELISALKLLNPGS
jgi:hypothetical protein